MVAVLCEARLLPWKMIFAKIEWKDTSKNPTVLTEEVKTTPSHGDWVIPGARAIEAFF